jgi:uncharacterized repeat protein (TIGR01451 family)
VGNKIRRGAYAALLLAWSDVHAATVAGTSISNFATVTYSIEGAAAASIVSAPASFKVDELIALTLIWQDGSPVSVNSPDNGAALQFLLTNTGNGTETFALTRGKAPAVADDYDPPSHATPLYIESNGTPGLQTGTGSDAAYAGSLTLAPEQSAQLYVVSYTPAALPNGATGRVALTAASTTPGAAGAAFGTVLPGAGDSGVTAVVGPSRGMVASLGSHLVSGLAASVVKTASVAGGGKAAPGKTLVYSITVSLSGTGTAGNLVVTDPLPAELTYVPDSITVNAASRTDAADGDNAAFSGNTVSVSFGDAAAPATHVITFSTIVN